MLRAHIDRMGLEASGRLKHDLQQCLCDAVRSGTGKSRRPRAHTPRRTAGKAAAAAAATPAAKKKGGGSGNGDRDEDEDDAGEPDDQPRRGRAGAPVSGRGKRLPPDQTDKSPVPVLPPGKVRFHNRAVSAMSHDEMKEALQDLDVASLRKDDEELTHDLIDALVLRKAEAAERNPKKQAWRGRLVYKMRKAELADMLEDFEVDDTGRVEEMRTRFRAALRKWAAEKIKLPASRAGCSGGGGGGSAGTGGAAAGAPSEPEVEEDIGSDVDEPCAVESSATDGAGRGKRRGRQAHIRLSDGAAATSSSRPKTSRASRKNPTKKPAGGVEGPAKTRATRSGRSRSTDKESAVSPKRAASPEAKTKATGEGLVCLCWVNPADYLFAASRVLSCLLNLECLVRIAAWCFGTVLDAKLQVLRRTCNFRIATVFIRGCT